MRGIKKITRGKERGIRVEQMTGREIHKSTRDARGTEHESFRKSYHLLFSLSHCCPSPPHAAGSLNRGWIPFKKEIEPVGPLLKLP